MIGMRGLERLLWSAALAVAIAPVAVRAQDPAEAVSRLKVGQHVRVQGRGLSVDLGRVSEIEGATLYVQEADQEWSIDVPTIERLEVRSHPVLRNVLIFGAIGAVAGSAAHKFRENVAPGPFTMGGLALGTLFGFTEWKWSVVYPR